MLEETRALIASWRMYKRMAVEDARYHRLVADFALIIRERIRRYGTVETAS